MHTGFAAESNATQSIYVHQGVRVLRYGTLKLLCGAHLHLLLIKVARHSRIMGNRILVSPNFILLGDKYLQMDLVPIR